MTIDTNSLGEFTFVTFHREGDPAGAPEGLRTETEVLTRFNVDGHGMVLGGTKGGVFSMRSMRDVDTIQDAHDLARDYRDAVGVQKEIIVWQGVDWETEYGVNYLIAGVKDIVIRKVSAAAGGLSTSKGAIIEATWMLVAVPQ